MADASAGRDYLGALCRGWRVVLAFVVLGGAVGFGITLARPTMYRASVQLLAVNSSTTNRTGSATGNAFMRDRAQAYTAIANSPVVTSAVVRQLGVGGLGITPQQLAAEISSDVPLNTVLINIQVTDHNPARAATLANAVSTQFAQVVERVEQTAANGRPLVKLPVIHPAAVRGRPIRPDEEVLYIGLGLLFGLLIGVGVVIARAR